MKIKSINQKSFNFSLIILIGYGFLMPHSLYALSRPQLKRCNTFKYTENKLILAKNLEPEKKPQKNLAQNISHKIKKIMNSILQITHWGIDLLTIINEIIDLTNH
ncbi:hypothetical protein OC691_00865 ['Cleome sp.' phytoplasma]|uniref:hypothetical protein n=1 Tax=Candidatus Phytoplasma australasiaticum TaxID=2754999 RepID=UPI0027139084|nr:hypothetical protein ['Cleome sp.' phytoplasma]MDO8054928.1 hypothetical protein ['Cleome sp.' phytoplasma]